jgi:imidazole glycerol-phosphate synthase subunit HisH
MSIGLVDYGMGNLRSVKNALEAVGASVRLIASGDALSGCRALVLPGVGAFGAGMSRLRERGLVEGLDREVRGRKTPFLGICLGMQLLATTGLEQGEHAGLGWIAGVVERLAPAGDLRVPHVGWNEVAGSGPIFSGTPESFYFVHSYQFVTDDPSLVSGRTDYGQSVVAAVQSGHIYGVQFHPEKSHRAGLALLKRFVDLAHA